MRVRSKKGEYRPRSAHHPSRRIFVSILYWPASSISQISHSILAISKSCRCNFDQAPSVCRPSTSSSSRCKFVCLQEGFPCRLAFCAYLKENEGNSHALLGISISSTRPASSLIACRADKSGACPGCKAWCLLYITAIQGTHHSSSSGNTLELVWCIPVG